jgi:hypothetical protein
VVTEGALGISDMEITAGLFFDACEVTEDAKTSWVAESLKDRTQLKMIGWRMVRIFHRINLMNKVNQSYILLYCKHSTIKQMAH